MLNKKNKFKQLCSFAILWLSQLFYCGWRRRGTLRRAQLASTPEIPVAIGLVKKLITTLIFYFAIINFLQAGINLNSLANSGKNSLAPMLKKVIPSVVHIKIY